MQKFPIDSHSNENFICLFFRPPGPPTPKLPRSRSWCLLYPEPKFHTDRTILRWDILNRTNEQTKKANLISRQTLRYGEIVCVQATCENRSVYVVCLTVFLFPRLNSIISEQQRNANIKKIRFVCRWQYDVTVTLCRFPAGRCSWRRVTSRSTQALLSHHDIART